MSLELLTALSWLLLRGLQSSPAAFGGSTYALGLEAGRKEKLVELFTAFNSCIGFSPPLFFFLNL